MNKRDAVLEEHEAVKRAKAACEANGYTWDEPIRARFEDGIYVIWTNAESLGANLVIRVDGLTGEIKEIRRNPR